MQKGTELECDEEANGANRIQALNCTVFTCYTANSCRFNIYRTGGGIVVGIQYNMMNSMPTACPNKRYTQLHLTSKQTQRERMKKLTKC